MPWISWKSWPVVHVDIVGAAGQDDVDATLGALAGGLERGMPFAVIVALDAAAARAHVYREGAGIDARKRRWLTQVRAALAERCRGVAYVMSPELLVGEARALAAARRAFACPTESFGSSAAARAWALGRLAGASALTPAPHESEGAHTRC